MVRNPPAVQETTCKAGFWGLIPGPESLEKEMMTHSSILAGKSPGQRSLEATVHGVARAGHNLVTKPPPPPDGRSSSHIVKGCASRNGGICGY